MVRVPELKERIAIHKEVVDLLNKKGIDLVSAHEILINIITTIEEQLKEAGYISVPAMDAKALESKIKN